jgi:ribonuclease R
MRDRVGEEFNGLITSVANFGLFVELEGLYVDGLVHVSSLKSDYYQHDAKQHRLVGGKNGQVYALGGRVRVKVVRVNLDERKIDLELIDGGAVGKPANSSKPAMPVKSGKSSRAGKGNNKSSQPQQVHDDEAAPTKKKKRRRR